MGASVYVRRDELFVPTELARGPWDPNAQHGGPPAALLARAFDGVEAPAPMQVARLTVDFLRPIPLAPLRLETEVVRSGRRVQVLTGTVWAGDERVCRAQALRIRVDELAVDDLPASPPPPPAPEEGSPGSPPFPAEQPVFHLSGVEFRTMGAPPPSNGAASVWLRMKVNLVEGEDPTPLVRAAVAADFGNGVAQVLDHRRYVFINPDLTLTLNRLPQDEWIGLESVTWAEHHGIGLAESALFDRRGRIGRAVQTLYLDRRPT